MDIDVLQPNLAVVFVGTAVSKFSAHVGAPYATASNAFWRTLHAVGLTPCVLDPHEYRTLPQYGIGLARMVPTAIGNDDALRREDFDPAGVRQQIGAFQPRVVAFNGKRAAQEFFGRLAFEYGAQPDRIGVTEVWVLPSTSGAARRYWDLTPWRELAAYLTADQTQR